MDKLSLKQARRGVSMVWAVTWMTVLSGFIALSVDVGRWQVVRTQLRSAADAAARAGAGALGAGRVAASDSAYDIAKKNIVDGRFSKNAEVDVVVGFWNANTKTFHETLPAGKSYNAVRVRMYRSKSRAGGVETTFGKLVGLDAIDASVEAIAMYTSPLNVNHVVDGRVNPFLSGMPSGSVVSLNNPHRNPDVLGTNVPTISSVGMPIAAGQSMTFDSISGIVRHDPNLAMFEPDGNLGSIGHNHNPSNGDMYGTKYYNENGIADMRAPINALVGIFLDDSAPNTTAAPTENLDFSTAVSRDFAVLKPRLKQVFFIGDGQRSDGTQQTFEVPQGATRLILATWDFYEWNNNAGSRTIKVSRPGKVTLVK